MSAYSAIQPRGAVTYAHREMFKKLVRLAEPRHTHTWMMKGRDQDVVSGRGSFHDEGDYVLHSVLKAWTGGDLSASSHSSFERLERLKLYYFDCPVGLVISTSRSALTRIAPVGCEVRLMEQKKIGIGA